MTRSGQTSLRRFYYFTASIVLIVAALYFTRVVLLPFVTALLLSFILSPAVLFMQRWRVPKVVSVITVVTIFLVVVSMVLLTFFIQFNELAKGLPKHRAQILTKIERLQHWNNGGEPGGFGQLVKDILRTLEKSEQSEEPDSAPVVVPVKMKHSFAPMIQHALGSTFELLVNVVLVLLLTTFALLKRTDLRLRLVSLIGLNQEKQTSDAIDDASQRISRFLAMQLIINSGFGIALAVGLYFYGVEYAAVWGFLAAILRYVPYIGPWLAAIMPLTLVAAINDSWTPFFVVFAYYLLLEMIVANVCEPLLFGRSIGVSEMALLVFAVFWTWLWGPMGLVLSTPLTAVLVTFGRHFSQLNFMTLLLADEVPAPVEPLPSLEAKVMIVQPDSPVVQELDAKVLAKKA